MRRFQYRITDLIGTRCARAERVAVLNGVVGPARTERAIRRGIYETRRLWMAQVKRLGPEGLGCGERSIPYLVNCPPVGVMTEGHHGLSTVCHQDRVCPWCWARTRVRRPFELLRGALSVDPGFSLVEVGLTVTPRPRTLEALVDLDLRVFIQCRIRFPFLGAVFLSVPKLNPRGWQARLRGLLLVDPAVEAQRYEEQVEGQTPLTIRQHGPECVNLEAVQHATGRFGRYPGWVLQEEHTGAVAELLQYRGRRAFRRYGCLRGVES